MLQALMGNASKVPHEQLQQEFGWALINGEQFILGYVLIRDMFIFTNKRLITVDKQGVSGRKMAILSIPYRSIIRFSTENAGSFLDMDSELRLWIRGETMPLTFSFRKDLNIQEVYNILSQFILNS